MTQVQDKKLQLHADFSERLARINQQLKTLQECEVTNADKGIQILAEEMKKKSGDGKYNFFDLTETEVKLDLQKESNETSHRFQYIKKGNSQEYLVL